MSVALLSNLIFNPREKSDAVQFAVPQANPLVAREEALINLQIAFEVTPI